VRHACSTDAMIAIKRHTREIQGSANTKTRSEVSGGGKKPLKQKGTGNARQGSTRTPLKPGGGVVFGPKPKDWSIDMNKKEKRLAMATALQSAAVDMVVVDTLPSLEDKKTKSLVTMCSNVGVDVMKTHTLLITADRNPNIEVAGKNVAKLALNTANCLQVYDVLRADKIIIEKAALDFLNEKYQ
jgi:large subunit ribosomal protein L4